MNQIAADCILKQLDPQPDPSEVLLKKNDVAELRRLIDQLPHRWAEVIRLRYGIYGDGPHSIKIVGQRISRSRSSVHQIEVKSLRKLTLQFRRVNQRRLCPDRNRQHF